MSDFSDEGEDAEGKEWLRQFRAYRDGKQHDLTKIRERLTNNDARLRKLESVSGPEGSKPWSAVLEDADLLITFVAAYEMLQITEDVPSEFTAQMQEVIDRFPGYTQERLDYFAHHASSASKEGAINQLMGYLGERVMTDAINNGALHLPRDWHAVLADTTNQAGWDVTISDSDGNLFHANFKVSLDRSIISHHFLMHPDIPVVITNTEAADLFAYDPTVTVVRPGDVIPDDAHHIVIDSGRHYAELHDFAEKYVDHAGHMADHGTWWKKLPWVSALLITATSLNEYTFSDTPGREILTKAGRRFRDVIVARGSGEGLDFVVPGDHSGLLSVFSLLTINSYRLAKGNFARSAELASASRQFLSELGSRPSPTA